MKIQYQKFNFRNNTLKLIEQANAIIAEYIADGYELTLRQLYYQFVARDIIPNKDSEYKRIGSIINDGRLAGLIDWEAIVDRTRQVKSNSHWSDPSEVVQSAANCYALDTRATQKVYIEAWIEKEALAGILERVCKSLDVPHFSCRGYTSQTAMWEAARRISAKFDIQKSYEKAVILHLGDHDPSGIDMTRDIAERLHLFNVNVEVRRIALNMDQIEAYNPPPNPAKLSDSRCNGYIAKYGNHSWELDALEPRTITALIRDNVEALTNNGERQKLIDQQESQRKKLQAIADNFDNLNI